MQVSVVDDSELQYNGPGWYAEEGQSGLYNHTVHWTCTPNATFSFAFSGPVINVYGTIYPGGPITSTWTVDRKHSDTHVTASVTNTTYQTLWYARTNLQAGRHTLSGTYLQSPNPPTPNQPCFSVDYITYTPDRGDSTSSQPASDKTAVLTSSSSTGPPTPQVSSDKTTSASSSDTSATERPMPHPNTGTIAGIVFAIIAALLALAAMSLLWRRYRRTQRELMAFRHGHYNSGDRYQDGPSVVVVRNDEFSRPLVHGMPSTAVFSSYYEPSDTPYSPTFSEKASLRPREPEPAKRNRSPERFGKRFSMASKASAMSRFRSLKIGAPPSTVPSSIVFAPPRADPHVGESRVSIVKDKGYDFDEV